MPRKVCPRHIILVYCRWCCCKWVQLYVRLCLTVLALVYCVQFLWPWCNGKALLCRLSSAESLVVQHYPGFKKNIWTTSQFGRQFLESFLRNGMPLLDSLFKSQHGDVQGLLKNLQQSTRYLQHICSHSKVSATAELCHCETSGDQDSFVTEWEELVRQGWMYFANGRTTGPQLKMLSPENEIIRLTKMSAATL